MAGSLFDLSGKVALVTGGNSGIGLGMATALAQAGADVAVWGSNAQKNAAAEQALQTTGRRGAGCSRSTWTARSSPCAPPRAT